MPDLKDPAGNPSDSVQTGTGMGDEYGEGSGSSGGYASMKVAELKSLADERDVEVASDAKKADLIAALEKADAGEPADAESGTGE